MILDAQNRFSNAQAVTATAASTDLIDLVAAGIDFGIGEPLYFLVNVDVAMTDSGSDSTITVTTEIDTAANFPSATTAQTIGVFAATSAIGARLLAGVQPLLHVERFLRLKYTVANGNLSAGSFSAYILTGPQLDKAYADGFTITS